MPTTKAIFEKFAVTDAGDVIPGAEYTVTNEATGTPLTIYSSREGAAKSAPYFADSTGLIQFYVDAGATFRVTVTGPTGTITSRYNQGLLFAESNTDQSSGRLVTTTNIYGSSSPNYHAGNLNVNEFGGGSANDEVAIGYAETDTTVRFYLPTASFVEPLSITLNSSFNILRLNGKSVVVSNASLSLSGLSAPNLTCIFNQATGAFVAGEIYILKANTADSKITVNF